MKNKYKYYTHNIYVYMISLMILCLSVISNLSFADDQKKEGQIYNDSLEWSDYVYIGDNLAPSGESGFLHVWHELEPGEKYLVYCYNQQRHFPTGNKYRKITVTGDNLDLLWDQLSSRDSGFWEMSSYDYSTFDKFKVDLVKILSWGYPVNKENLEKQFPDATERELIFGTQKALWTVIHNDFTMAFGSPIARYIIDKWIMNKDYNEPVLGVYKLSFFQAEPQFRFNDPTDGRQNLLSLTYVPDYVPKKELKVSKEWKGLSPEVIEKLPEVTVSVLQNDLEITTLKLTKDNNWQATCKVEDKKDYVYTIKEVGELNGKVLVNGNDYIVDINNDVENEFKIINTLVPKTYDIEINKIDTDKNLLEGAELKIIKGEDLNGVDEVKKWLTVNQPEKITLNAGIYTLVEIKAPSNYKISSPIIFKVTDLGKLEIKNSDGQYVEEPNLTINMVDEKEVQIDNSGNGTSNSGGSSSSGGSDTSNGGGDSSSSGGNDISNSGGGSSSSGGNDTSNSGGGSSSSGGNDTSNSGGGSSSSGRNDTSNSGGGSSSSGGNGTSNSGGDSSSSSNRNDLENSSLKDIKDDNSDKEKNEKKELDKEKNNILTDKDTSNGVIDNEDKVIEKIDNSNDNNEVVDVENSSENDKKDKSKVRIDSGNLLKEYNDVVQTDDTNNILLYVVSLSLSFLMILYFIKKRNIK